MTEWWSQHWEQAITWVFSLSAFTVSLFALRQTRVAARAQQEIATIERKRDEADARARAKAVVTARNSSEDPYGRRSLTLLNSGGGVAGRLRMERSNVPLKSYPQDGIDLPPGAEAKIEFLHVPGSSKPIAVFAWENPDGSRDELDVSGFL